jgi:hypothetical protein
VHEVDCCRYQGLLRSLSPAHPVAEALNQAAQQQTIDGASKVENFGRLRVLDENFPLWLRGLPQHRTISDGPGRYEAVVISQQALKLVSN